MIYASTKIPRIRQLMERCHIAQFPHFHDIAAEPGRHCIDL